MIAIPLTIVLLTIAFFNLSDLITRMDPAASSDIIPTVEIASKRLLNNIPVYTTPIYAVDHQLPLTYLPMHWMPYLISSVFNFDPRWLAFGMWLLAVLYLTVRNYKTDGLSALFCTALLAYITYRSWSILANTIELMVAAYYILFIIFLNKKNALLLGLIIGTCLLSRFSLVLWLPLMAFSFWVAGKRKELLATTLVTFVFVLVVYIIPFLSPDWTSFGKGLQYYTAAALGEWEKGDRPFHLHRGVGFAYYFFHSTSGTIEHKVHLLQNTHLFMCIISTVVMGIWYYYNRGKIDLRIFLLASFKIYLTVFLAFIQVPYEYLMIVGNFVSIAIYTEQTRYRLIPQV